MPKFVNFGFNLKFLGANFSENLQKADVCSTVPVRLKAVDNNLDEKKKKPHEECSKKNIYIYMFYWQKYLKYCKMQTVDQQCQPRIYLENIPISLNMLLILYSVSQHKTLSQKYHTLHYILFLYEPLVASLLNQSFVIHSDRKKRNAFCEKNKRKVNQNNVASVQYIYLLMFNKRELLVINICCRFVFVAFLPAVYFYRCVDFKPTNVSQAQKHFIHFFQNHNLNIFIF